MKNLASRMAAVAGLVAFLGLYGCNEDGQKDAGQGGSAAAVTSASAQPAYAPVSSETSSAMQVGPSAAQTSNDADNPVAPAEQAKEQSNQTFDGNGDHSSLTSSNDSAVQAPPSSQNKQVPYTAAPPKKELDDTADAPPAPEKDPQVAACEQVLAAHDQDSSGCQDHPNLSLEYAGIKNAVREQFGSVTAVVSTLVLTALGMLLSGGLAAMAKVLKILLVGASVVMLVKQIALLYQAVKALFTQAKGSEEYAEGVRQVAESVTTIGIMAGAFTVGSKVGEAKASAPAQGELPFPEKPGVVSRAWQSVRGWLTWRHA